MRPSEQLTGLKLEGGWTVVERIGKGPKATGGHFSTGYRVVNEDGRQGFLKAMDYTEALAAHADTAKVLQAMTEAYLFEKAICQSCRNSRLRRIIHAIDSGSVVADPSSAAGKVEYLIFELAEGDIRTHLDKTTDMDVVFLLRVLHNVAVGIQQLHSVQIAHQDLKPSNVLVLAADDGSKVSDLGRAWASSLPAPHDSYPIAGDRGYAPWEFVYREVPSDVTQRRYGCDTYHFGSLIVYLFARVHVNALVDKYLAVGHKPFFWRDTFANVLPYLQAAFANAMKEFEGYVPEYIRSDVSTMVRQLCEPDPSKRGHPLNIRGSSNSHKLERYISQLDLLASKAKLHLLGN